MVIAKTQEEITKLVIKKIESQMEILKMSSKLCVPIAAGVAAEHNLHGTIEGGIETLRLLKNRFRKYLKSQQTVEMIQLMVNRLDVYNKEQADDPYAKAAHEAMMDADRRKMHVVMQRSIKRTDDIHNRMECICFN